MNRLNRVLLSAVMAGGLCGGTGFVLAGSSRADSSGGGQPVQRLDDEHWKFVHMHHALASLQEARKELDDAEDIFHGHKQDAIDHVEAAIKEVRDGLHEQNDDAALPAALPSAGRLDDERFPHVRRAMERLKDAKRELEAAEPIFAGHRDEAVRRVYKALKQLEDGIGGA